MSDDGDAAERWRRTGERARGVLNLREEITRRESRMARAIDHVGHALARPSLFAALFVVHAGWIVANLPLYPWFSPWDPYPFTFLATAAAAEAPFITLLVLMYQRRQSRVAELREELDLQVALHLERQMSILLHLVRLLQKDAGVHTDREEGLLDDLEQELDPRQLMETVRRQLDRAPE